MTQVSDLSHHTIQLPEGGMVLVLDTGAVITAEDQAMLGAMHSRSIGGIHRHLLKLAKSGSGNFMSQFYVGYGHKSIADMGGACVFIEDVSMLTAKAIQDFPLYNGQEASTRYIDFADQRFIDPLNTLWSSEMLESWRSFYLEGLEVMQPILRERYPFIEATDGQEKNYAKAIKARAFDTMRSFLPAGASTNLVWVGPLRQFADQLPLLRNHPLSEVRDIAHAIEAALIQTFPNSFSQKRYEETEEYVLECQDFYAYFEDPSIIEFGCTHDAIRMNRLAEYREAFTRRPSRMIELPWRVRECGTMEFSFRLDFASFRDLQRHRSVTIPMPLLTMDLGFEPWYLNELPDDFCEKAEQLLERQRGACRAISDPYLQQYYLPMGYQVPIRMTGDLRALTYLVERRARNDVHPTLRHRAGQIGDFLMEKHGPHRLVLHREEDADRFSLARGNHDIVER